MSLSEDQLSFVIEQHFKKENVTNLWGLRHLLLLLRNGCIPQQSVVPETKIVLNPLAPELFF